jgi:aminoglycoside phosphotransferase (APT) family kinase protein
MLSPAHADLIRRDPIIPGLATLLDADAFVELLRRQLPETDLRAAQITSVKYKPGTNCLVGYRAYVGDAATDVYAKAYRLDAHANLQKARERKSVPGALGPGRIIVDDCAIVVCAFPNDNEIRSLRRLADTKERNNLLEEILPVRPDLWDATLERLAYWPEHRYVARLSAAGRPLAVLKAYELSAYGDAWHRSQLFKSQGALRLAPPIGFSERRRVLAFEWLPGRVLSEAIGDENLNLAQMARVGAAIAELHAQDPPSLSCLTRDTEAATLLREANELGSVCPHLARRVRELAERLANKLVKEPPVLRPIHGDFHARQLLVTDDSVSLIDLDRAIRADPVIDLALFVAHLEREAVRGTLPAARIERLADALLEGYRAATFENIPRRYEWYRAVELLRLAPRFFRYCEPNWPERAEAIVERAESIVRQTPNRAQRTACNRGAAPNQLHSDDPLGAASDTSMPFLSQALDPFEVERRLENCLANSLGRQARARLIGIRVVRHKPGRRCVIEYELELETSHGPHETLTLIGKSRARGLDEPCFRLLKELAAGEFAPSSDDGICVPEPMGVVPEFHMWLQRKVPGTVATHMLLEPDGVTLARRIAEAAHKLHRVKLLPQRSHSMVDELRILRDRLARVAQIKPAWTSRLDRVLAACNCLAAATREPQPCGIHRDFYADHAIVDGPRLYLLDFDLWCRGDPSLDIGNFAGHVIEQSLRSTGDPDALADRHEALVERFLELAGASTRASVRTYTTLTLVRHIYLSTQHPNRQPITESLLELCEQHLDISNAVFC